MNLIIIFLIFNKNNNLFMEINNSTNTTNIDESQKWSSKFIFYTAIGLIIVVLLAILIPYYFYRRNKRKLMDRLNYEIIYRKVEDTKINLLHSNSLKNV